MSREIPTEWQCLTPRWLDAGTTSETLARHRTDAASHGSTNRIQGKDEEVQWRITRERRSRLTHVAIALTGANDPLDSQSVMMEVSGPSLVIVIAENTEVISAAVGLVAAFVTNERLDSATGVKLPLYVLRYSSFAPMVLCTSKAIVRRSVPSSTYTIKVGLLLELKFSKDNSWNDATVPCVR